MDSVAVRGRSFLILADSSIYIENDTVILLPDTIAVKLRRDETRRSEEFYNNLKNKFYKKKFTKELYDILFVDVNTSQVKAEPVSNQDFYQLYAGKRIKEISVKKLEVFGTSINDTTKHTNSWAIRVANSLHVYTRSYIIRNNLFFETGDVLDPDLLKDSERVLRSLPYIKDARIYIVPDEENSELVGVLILVKDVWSISGELKIGNLQKSDVAVIDRNFLGLGQEFRNEFLYDSDNRPMIGYNGTYTINNIRKTFITGEVNYARSEPTSRYAARIYRNFITPEIKYAGGIDLSHNIIQAERQYPDTTYEYTTKYNLQDYWFGRSWLIGSDDEHGRTNIQAAIGYSKYNYIERPITTADTNQVFFDRKFYLYSVGISRRNYERSTLINGYGRTEDIPIGYLLEFTAGREFNEFYNRTYAGWRFSAGKYFGRLGYIRPSIQLGGFVHGGHLEQGVLRTGVQFFSYLYRYHKVNLRQFLSIDYVLGVNRFGYEYIDINDRRGVRGLSNTFLRGSKKLSIKAETVAFTPFYLVGFRFAIFGFADLAIVNLNSAKLLKNKLYQGYGIGLRLRNENLAFNTIQIRLAWYPQVPEDESSFGIRVSGQSNLGIPDFRIEKPAVIEF